MAYLIPAKSLALLAVDLLYGNGEKGKEILAAYQPEMSKEDYLAFQNNLFRTELYDGEKEMS